MKENVFNNSVFAYIKSQDLFKDLSINELEQIAAIIETKKYPIGTHLYKAGDTSSDIYFIVEGEIEFYKNEPESPKGLKIASLSNGGMIGDMSFIENTIRTTTVTVTKDTSILVLEKDKCNKLFIDNHLLKQKIITNIARINVSRLRTANNSHINSLKKQIEDYKSREFFGHFFVLVMITLGVGDVINKIATNYTFDVNSRIFSWAFLLLILIPNISFIYYFKYKLEDFGVTLKNSLLAIKIGAKYGIVSSILLLLTYYLKNLALGNNLEDIAFNPETFNITQIAYFFHSYIQEFIARGIFQNSVQKFFDDKKGLKSVFLTSLVFAVFHLQYGFIVTICTFIGGLVLGHIYLKNNNLLGVTVAHYLVGTTLSLIYII